MSKAVSNELSYISGYPDELKVQVQQMLDDNSLADYLLNKYPESHDINNDKELRDYVFQFKNRYLKKSAPLSKVIFDQKIHLINHALGLHSFVSRVQGGKLKAKNEIRISTIFKDSPKEFLDMILVHELAHLKEKQHNKAFYQLCQHMLSDYFQLEFDTRLYLIQLELNGHLYPQSVTKPSKI